MKKIFQKKMPQLPNYQRMFQIIDDVFATRQDPDQLQVDEEVIKKLNEIHPACLSELADENGPVIWVLMIPTTEKVMDDFLSGKISERELLDQTRVGEKFTCLYLCSVTTLPEYRQKGETKKICLKAIEKIRVNFPIATLYVWAFTPEGESLAQRIASETKLPLKLR
ncbi:MAG: hypothetical protein IPG07_08500 [Crocinitomicaceae bacterium]|nr:hypothetical protein [Crocinitomicaceae bacterium]